MANILIKLDFLGPHIREQFVKKLASGENRLELYLDQNGGRLKLDLVVSVNNDKVYAVSYNNANPVLKYVYVLKCPDLGINGTFTVGKSRDNSSFIPAIISQKPLAVLNRFKVHGRAVPDKLKPADVFKDSKGYMMAEQIFPKEVLNRYKGLPPRISSLWAPVKTTGDYAISAEFYSGPGMPNVNLYFKLVRSDKEEIFAGQPVSALDAVGDKKAGDYVFTLTSPAPDPAMAKMMSAHEKPADATPGATPSTVPSTTAAAAVQSAANAPAAPADPLQASQAITAEDIQKQFAADEDVKLLSMPRVQGFYSKAEAEIRIRNPKNDSAEKYERDITIGRLPVSDFRWVVGQPQNPVYGFASVEYDYLAYGRTLVQGNFAVNIGDYNAVNRMISNSNPFGHHMGESFDIVITVGDAQFHRGMGLWYKQEIRINGVRLSEMGGDHALTGEGASVGYAFIGKNIVFNAVVSEMRDVYEVDTFRNSADPGEMSTEEASSDPALTGDPNPQEDAKAAKLKDGTREKGAADAKKADATTLAQGKSPAVFNQPVRLELGAANEVLVKMFQVGVAQPIFSQSYKLGGRVLTLPLHTEAGSRYTLIVTEKGRVIAELKQFSSKPSTAVTADSDPPVWNATPLTLRRSR